MQIFLSIMSLHLFPRKRPLYLLCLFACFFGTALNSAAQRPDWVKYTVGGYPQTHKKLATDKAGNIFAFGSFKGKVTFDRSTRTDTLISTDNSFDLFLSKSDPEGNIQWIKHWVGYGDTYVTSIHIDDKGIIYLFGLFYNVLDADPGIAADTLVWKGGMDPFVIKLTSEGDYIWGKSIGGSGDDDAGGIAIDKEGNVYVSGNCYLDTDFDPNEGEYTLPWAGNMFLCKLSRNGDFKWARNFGNYNPYNKARSLAVSDSGVVYLGGNFAESGDLDPGTGSTVLTSQDRETDIYLSKFDSSGRFYWAKQFGGFRVDQLQKVQLDAEGNLFFFGCIADSADFDPSPSIYMLRPLNNLLLNGCLTKLDKEGHLIWAKLFDGAFPNYPLMAFGPMGDIFLGGVFFGSIDIDPGIDTYYLHGGSNSFTNSFICKLNASGDFVWANRWNSLYTMTPTDLCTNNQGHLFVAMQFSSNLSVQLENDSYVYTSSEKPGEIVMRFQTETIITDVSKERSNRKQILVYPNPSNGNFIVQYPTETTTVKLTIRSMEGLVVFVGKSVISGLPVCLEAPKGMYLAEVEGEDGTSVIFKIVKN